MYLPMWVSRINMKEIIEKSLTVKKNQNYKFILGNKRGVIPTSNYCSCQPIVPFHWLSWTFRVVPGIGDLACLVAHTIL